MEITISKTIKFLLLVGMVFFISACSILGGGADEDIEALQEQINQMATQNALLLERVEGSNDEEVQAPPPPDEDSQPQESMLTPTPESLPDQPVPAGVPIIYGGWSITVSKEINVLENSKQFGLIIFVRNLGETKRTFRFMNASVAVKDNLGNIYEYVNTSTCEKIHYDVKNMEVDGEDSESVFSISLGYNNCDGVHGIDVFQGPIPIEAEQLIISFQDFGPFTGIEVIIDL